METLPLFDKRNPFTVPDGYFEDFAAKMDRLTQRPSLVLPWYHQAKSWIAMAAAIAGIIIGVKMTNFSTSPFTSDDDMYKTYVLGQMDEASMVACLCDLDGDGNDLEGDGNGASE